MKNDYPKLRSLKLLAGHVFVFLLGYNVALPHPGVRPLWFWVLFVPSSILIALPIPTDIKK